MLENRAQLDFLFQFFLPGATRFLCVFLTGLDEGMVANQLVVLILFQQVPKLYRQDPGILGKYFFHQK